jgi:hypothetical protein
MTSAFEQFDSYIGQNFSEQYWADVATEDADEMIEEFSATDWQDLQSALPARPPFWIERLVSTLGGVEPSRSVPLLASILRDCEPRSLGAVACALRELDDSALRAAVDESGAQRLASAAMEKDQPHRYELEDVLARWNKFAGRH